MKSQRSEAQSLWAAWTNLSMQDDTLYLQFDAQSPKRLVVPPAYTMGLLRELQNQLGHIGRKKTGEVSKEEILITLPSKGGRGSVRVMRLVPCPETATSDPQSASVTDSVRLPQSGYQRLPT